MPTPTLVATPGAANANSYPTVAEAWAYIDTLPWKGEWPTRVNASTTLGAGANGVVTVSVDDPAGAAGNDLTVEVVAGVGNNVDLSAVLTVDALVVTLGTDGAGALDATKNTAVLVAGAIDDLDEFTATASGSGTTVVPVTAEKNFAGGDDREDIIIPLLIHGTRLVDSIRISDTLYAWTGSAASATQALGWPRIGMLTRNGFPIPTDEIPEDLKFATIEYAKALRASDLTANSSVEGIAEVKAGPVAVRFKGDASSYTGFKPVPESVLLLIPRSWLEHDDPVTTLLPFEVL